MITHTRPSGRIRRAPRLAIGSAIGSATVRAGLAMRTLALLAISALLALTAVITGPTPAAQAANGHKYEQTVARRTNHERTSRGLVKLTWSACLDRYAEAQARKMARLQSLQHQALRPILDECGLRSTGENIAVGFPGGKSVTRAWMRSPGHRANILRKEYRSYGVGAYKDSNGTWWVSHVFGRRA